MTRYVATINVPGYLPMADDPPVFDSAAEAWSYLRDERMRGEDDAGEEGFHGQYGTTVDELARWTVAPQEGFPFADWTGTVYGPTPGYDGDHDLGLAYSVSIVEDDLADMRDGGFRRGPSQD